MTTRAPAVLTNSWSSKNQSLHIILIPFLTLLGCIWVAWVPLMSPCFPICCCRELLYLCLPLSLSFFLFPQMCLSPLCFYLNQTFNVELRLEDCWGRTSTAWIGSSLTAHGQSVPVGPHRSSLTHLKDKRAKGQKDKKRKRQKEKKRKRQKGKGTNRQKDENAKR